MFKTNLKLSSMMPISHRTFSICATPNKIDELLKEHESSLIKDLETTIKEQQLLLIKNKEKLAWHIKEFEKLK